MNCITVAGRIGKDAEQRFLNDGAAVLNFTVADRRSKDETIWWDCSLYGKRAEAIAAYLTKGTQVSVSGTLTQREYIKDGVKCLAFNLRVFDIALQGKPEQSAEKPEKNRYAAAKGKAQPKKADVDEDIPF